MFVFFIAIILIIIIVFLFLGQALSRGVHDLIYVATDNSGNTEKCSFRINIMSM